MQFLYEKNAGNDEIIIEGDDYKYLFKVKRYRKDEKIILRNMIDDYKYEYKIIHIDKKRATLQLCKKELKRVALKREFHLVWCIIEPKVIEKTLPMLNEIGVSSITFVYCQRSQKNFKPNIEKLTKIVINSSQQCGRSTLMRFEIVDNLAEIFKKFDDIVIVDFSDKKIDCSLKTSRVLVGCEGGFTKEERELFKDKKVLGFDTDMILKSQTATVLSANLSILG